MTLPQRHAELAEERLRLLEQRLQMLMAQAHAEAPDRPRYDFIIGHIEHHIRVTEARLGMIEKAAA